MSCSSLVVMVQKLWDEMTCCFIVSHLLEYSVMFLYYGCWIWHTLSERLQSSHRDRVHTAHGILGTQRMNPVHCLLTDQCRPPGLDQRALRCVLVRERKIHRKISSNLKVATFCVLRLTQYIKTS